MKSDGDDPILNGVIYGLIFGAGATFATALIAWLPHILTAWRFL